MSTGGPAPGGLNNSNVVSGDCVLGHLIRRQQHESRVSQRQLRTATLGVVIAVVATGSGVPAV
jgi:hypothetical protein